ncbi:MAG: 30S ribosomal protein S6 [Lutispora sp.]|jgi:small subunit ribosomal protein S6|uniref:30S ribosomal protein S6 n=1 Tax=Lutispora sp. TaxID=2828727 RepID=UPI00356675B5
MNLYETIYIIKPDVEEEAIKALVEKFKALIEENGEIDTIDEWGKRKLAYLIEDYAEGYYVYMKYKAESHVPKELDRVFGITEDIIRHLIVKLEK